MRPSDDHAQDAGGGAEPALESTSPLEWVIAGLSGLLLAATLAYMVIFAFSEQETPPAVTLSVATVTTTPGGYLVVFRADNAGGAAAAGLQVSGELREGGAVVETSQATIDYLPQRSERRGGLFFTRNPEDLALSLRAEGYSEP
jgi:uncharacterized protein (TIGR02588 family)